MAFPFADWDNELFKVTTHLTGEPWLNLNREQFIEEQQKGDTLTILREEAEADDADYHYFIEEKMLYHLNITEMGDSVTQIVVPTNSRRKLFEVAYQRPLTAHLGKNKTLKKLKAHIYWQGIGPDIAAWYKECRECQNGDTASKARAPLCLYP